MQSGTATHRSRSHDAVIRVYDDEADKAIEAQEHKGEFRE
jgi:hypothetical protein